MKTVSIASLSFVMCFPAVAGDVITAYIQKPHLRAAYCMPTLINSEAALAELSKANTSVKTSHDRSVFVLNKARNFLLIRSMKLTGADLEETVIAKTEGEVAAKRAGEISKQCISQSNTTVELDSCISKMGYKDLNVDSCSDLSYLPY